jgi:hypothetical protein
MTHEVFMEVRIHIMVFWVIRECSLVDGYQRFEKYTASTFTVEEMGQKVSPKYQ